MLGNAQWYIFICACLMSFGPHFVSHVFSPLKDIIKTNLGLSNTQFGLLQSSELLFQSITPFIGGAVTDMVGPRKSSFIATSIFLSGEILMTVAVSFLPKNYQFEFLGLGQLLFGLGAGWMITVLEIIIVQNYSRHSVAFAMGTLFAVNKLSGFLATGISVHVVEWTGTYVSIFWLSFLITLLSWSASIVYSHIVSPEDHSASENEIDMAQANSDSNVYLQMLTPRPSVEFREEIKSPITKEIIQESNFSNPLMNILKFEDKIWYYLLVIRVLVGATWTPFLRLLSNIIKHMYIIPESEAAWQASISLGLPIFLGPFFGYIQDRFQTYFTPQPYFIVFTSFLATLSFSFIGSPYITSPYPSLILFAITLGCGPLALTTLAPVLLSSRPESNDKIGVLFGLQTSISHMVGALMDTFTGYIQDTYSVKYPQSFGNGYVQVMKWLLALSILELIGSVIFVLIWFPPSFFSNFFKPYTKAWTKLPLHPSNTESQLPTFSNIPARKYFYLFTLIFIFMLVWGSYLIMLM